MSVTTVINRIRSIASVIQTPTHFQANNDYEMDEMHTCVWLNNRREEAYIAYAISIQTKQVVNFTVGGRDKETLRKTINKILFNYPKSIRTDGWIAYSCIIPNQFHIRTPYKLIR